MNQVDHVLAHLEAGKSITPASAIAVYGIFRLSSVIEDLRLRGVPIDMVLKVDEMGKKYGEYRITQSPALNKPVQIRRGHGWGLPDWVRKLRSAIVVGTHEDTSLVRFVRGTHMEDIWMNNKELVRAD